jgi:choline-glycine betaine transporter
MDGGEQLGRCLSFLDSGATEKEEEKKKNALFYSFYHFSIKSHFVYCLLTV